ncbi:hypothetical protein Bca52824_015076 [Brassica carinata]|uniref:Reverse transcriptase zinc-binding domain-containing protein n=1 Tax=Brassica carinata TaxID=52824 RepID=A0A8X8B511_BRACI|nr:hypothetical protein Bca52824_015076 [Brassica carinata]
MVKEWIANHRPVFGAYLETHIQPINARRIISSIPRGWKFFANWDHHHTARIVVVWNPNVLTTIYKSTSQAVTCGFFLPLESLSITVTFVYGCNEVEARRELWRELETLNATTPVSNYLCKESNHHSNVSDLDVDLSGMEDMNLAMQEAEIFEAQCKGLSYTWWNNQEANPISKKIDHGLVNQSWAVSFSEGYAEFMEPHQFDHAPCLFHLPSAQRRVPKPFKFFNHIADHPRFEETLVRSLKLLKKDLRSINKRFYSGISQRVKEQAEVVSQLQRQILTYPEPNIAVLEHEARDKWQLLAKAEENFFHQRSRITLTLHSWTTKLLSFAGKINLITSVIYSKVIFWSAVFVLPKSFYAKIESLCAAFLWGNKSSPSRGARVSWKDVCRPKREGGLGIRLLEAYEMVFRLKHVWNFFSNSESLWVAWLKANVFHRKPFWIMEDSPRLSKAVRSMVQIKNILADFLRCQLGDWRTALFWYDSWTELGHLLNFIGAAGPRQMRVRLSARVTLQIALTTIPVPAQSMEDDKYLWIQANGSFGSSFSSKVTWECIRRSSPVQFWHKAIWFKEYIPRNSFMAWLALLRRLPTRDRLRSWGLTVPEQCVLCSAAVETHHHLFFECQFSANIWLFFAGSVWPNPPLDIHSAAAWICSARNSSSPQARNRRIFTSSSLSADSVRCAIDRQIRDRLLSLPPSPRVQPSMLQFFFACTRPP